MPQVFFPVWLSRVLSFSLNKSGKLHNNELLFRIQKILGVGVGVGTVGVYVSIYFTN